LRKAALREQTGHSNGESALNLLWELALESESSIHPARIFAVVALYGQRPSASVTVATLSRALEGSSADCAVLVYDNSPDNSAEPRSLEPGVSETMPAGFRYEAAATNRGLLGAYEAALDRARAEGYDWLLTLDQDTALPADFFSAIEPGLRAARENPRIATIVPHLAEGERLLSPAYVGLSRTKPVPASFSGVPEREARAFNSAALLRVEALEAIGGFDPCFWLDHLDSWLHHQLYVHGWRMYVLDSVHLEHHFSLLNYRDRVSLDHLRNFLAAESAYFDLYCSPLAGAAHTVQLAGRLVKQTGRRETREVRGATWSALWQRLTVSKSKRVAAWREAMVKRMGGTITESR
jgi:GT2 family glycosyltransferase